jgi:ADP-ribose pyrophosphatase YjhB (NUDIX family)
VKRKLPLTAKEFKEIYSKVPRLCVDLVIVTEDGFLLTLRKKHGYEGQWHLPGGTIYYGESVKKAVKRIAEEELGVDVKIMDNYGYLEYFSEVKERGYGYTISLVFICKPRSVKFMLDDQVEKVSFFKLPPENTILEQKKLLKEMVKNQDLSI